MLELLYIIGLTIWLALSSCPLALTSCCCGCNYFTDNFSTDNLATDYTTVSGSWSVSGGKITTSSSNALVLVNSTSISNHHLHTVTPTLTAVGDTSKVIAGYQDADNYLFAELTRGASNTTAKFYKRVAGVETQVGTARTLNTSAPTVTFCCGDNKTLIIFSWPGGFGTLSCRISSTTVFSTGNRVGIGTGTVVSDVSFDSLTFAKHQFDNPDCSVCAPNCTVCGTDADHDNARWRITITGWARGSCVDVTGCEDHHNGQWYTEACSGPCGMAQRSVSLGNFCGGFFTEFVEQFEFPAASAFSAPPYPPIPSSCTARVITWIQHWAITSPNIIYEKDLAGLNLSGVHTLPIVYGGSGSCDGTAAVCTAELIP